MRWRGMPTERLQAIFLPRLVDGSWSGTMCLTEPQCGTDLGLIRTRAVPAGDGSFRVDGTKIFISAGEHDLTENIVHLVLAKLPDAPAGTRGISLFVVPKFLPVEGRGGWRSGERNGVRCAGIEHKMGIRASSTCTMQFEDAVGWLVGAPHQGMAAMFTMMNAARLAVGIQGLAAAEAAYQEARAYALERLQGRSPAGPHCPDRPADPIIVHPDVRRTLLTIKAFVEGARALAYWVGLQLDRAERHPDPAERQAADDLAALMTPIVKALPHRPRLRRHEPRHAGIRRPRLHPRDRRRAVCPRRAHRPDLRGRERHPGPGPGRPQARPAHGPPAPPLLPSGGGLPGGSRARPCARRPRTCLWPRLSPSCSRPPF